MQLFLKDTVFIPETCGKILYNIFDFMFILGKSLEIFVGIPNSGFYNNTHMPKYPPPSPGGGWWGWGGGGLYARGRFIEKKISRQNFAGVSYSKPEVDVYIKKYQSQQNVSLCKINIPKKLPIIYPIGLGFTLIL